MGITFAYELGLKSFIYEKSSTRKVTSKFNWGNPVKHFQNPQKPNTKKVTGLSRSRGKKIQKKGLGYFVRMHDRFGMIPRETNKPFSNSWRQLTPNARELGERHFFHPSISFMNGTRRHCLQGFQH